MDSPVLATLLSNIGHKKPNDGYKIAFSGPSQAATLPGLLKFQVVSSYFREH